MNNNKEKLRLGNEISTGVGSTGTLNNNKESTEWREKFKVLFGTDQYGGKFAWRQDLVIPFVSRLLSEQRKQIDKEYMDFAEKINKSLNEQIEEIREYCLDERDKAEKDTDEYNEGYFMAMNTVVKYLDSLK